MSQCRSSFARLCARRAELASVNVDELLSKHDLSRTRFDDVDAKIPWPFFAELLDKLEVALGGARCMEQFGAELGAAHPLFGLLAKLHFSLDELQCTVAEQWVPNVFSGVLQTLVNRQLDGAVRITVSLARDVRPSYSFWTLLLGLFRPLPRFFDQTDSLIEVEMAERFAEYLVIFPDSSTSETTYGHEIRRSVREHLLKELITYEELCELPTPDLRSSVFERRVEAAENKVNADPTWESNALQSLKSDMLERLRVDKLALYELVSARSRQVARVGEAIDKARLRRILWLNGTAVGGIEVPRPSEGGHASVSSLLDEHIDSFAYRFAQLQNRVSFGVGDGRLVQSDALRGDPTTIDAPPSSRGRVARAARDGRLSELTAQWKLTERQRAVLALLVEGLGNKELAARLGCSVGTVENHVTRLLKSAQVDGRAALTALFWRTRASS
jgi:DNA-binding CsgD family transcriptional regulator